ncbi:hypothetical protein N7494_001679 [Penicillium frequentans]|uniref:NADP-dependent oxidoreductase domain-containing protein n=1 Tax=Penicillium frequentans TaxID=3151616 RepID=A0AAD6D260_9EURO|nr:hypothetical protein N7494_001679 [Penicillium glabrum]
MRETKRKTAHVNMMADSLIANLPLEGLRVVLRGMLANRPDCTTTFEDQARSYTRDVTLPSAESVETSKDAVEYIQNAVKHVCCMLGCGLCYEALPVIQTTVEAIGRFLALTEGNPTDESSLSHQVTQLDGVIVQAVTAVQKSLVSSTGSRNLSENESKLLERLLDSLANCKVASEKQSQLFLLDRGLETVEDFLHPETFGRSTGIITPPSSKDLPEISEKFAVNGVNLPRIFTGLWQLSSPAWGSAPQSKIMEQFSKYVDSGFTAFDMADHYGDAEIIFGRYRSSSAFSKSVFAATKYCVFHPMKVSREAVVANIDERCQRLKSDSVDLLQFHWQHYEDSSYIQALKYIQEDTRVKNLGLCNFDTEHMQKVIDSGVKVYTNQVQFSLVDSRPTVRMAALCERHDVKLLTYGTLCGGLVAERWIGKDAPDLYGETVTPSQRKYLAMINSWGGWALFQELLKTLHLIAQKHGVSLSNVATRWVLDFPYVGAVIVGTRMGISQQCDESLASLGWNLDADDQKQIQDILNRSRRTEMFESLGDCGGEYR